MAEIKKDDLKNRALSIQGHMGAVARMIDEDAYCIDIIKQTQAVQKAIEKLNALLLERHLGSCVTTAIRSNNSKERERVINELLDVFETTAKL
jgi:CsoR family transcriptional regulator, copper-sensing transcriptional repressor